MKIKNIHMYLIRVVLHLLSTIMQFCCYTSLLCSAFNHLFCIKVYLAWEILHLWYVFYDFDISQCMQYPTYYVRLITVIFSDYLIYILVIACLTLWFATHSCPPVTKIFVLQDCKSWMDCKIGKLPKWLIQKKIYHKWRYQYYTSTSITLLIFMSDKSWVIYWRFNHKNNLK